MKLDVDKLDFDHCEDEPIHVPELVQSYGYLFALKQDNGEVAIVSQNVEDLLQTGLDIIGSNFFELLDEAELTLEFLRESYQRARDFDTRLPVEISFRDGVVKSDQCRDYYAVVYNSKDHFVIELEPAASFRDVYSAWHQARIYSQSISPRFKTMQSLDELAAEMVRTVKDITEMERVVLYRFDKDGSARVIAETKVDDLDSYLGLYYPAGDIPPQARALYLKNWIRLVPDVDLEPSPLIPASSKSGRQPLDLTQSILRSLSPIHLQYIRNQGLKASMSMSLVTHDYLWGMISCHSRKTSYIPQKVRLECENLSQLFSWHLYAKEEELFFRKRQQADETINSMLGKISEQQSIIDVFRQNQNEVLGLLAADGFVFYSSLQEIAIGATPDSASVLKICQTFASDQSGKSMSADVSGMVDDPETLNGIRGALFMPLSESQDYFTVWFRKEQPLVQKWVGGTDENSVRASKRERLTPRKSFSVNIKEIRGQSQAWNENDKGMAERFNRVFMSYALETQKKMHENLSSLEKQDRHKNEFLATLAHELRNPLTPISTGVAILGSEHSEEVRGRVLATMSRQIGSMTRIIEDLMDVARVTKGKISLQRAPLRIQDAIKDAIESYRELINDKGQELIVDMPDQPIYVNGDLVRLTQIFSNIIGNSAKYTDENGRIAVRLSRSNSAVFIRISDNGIGIAPENLGLIFSMFTQMENDNARSKGGLGIGLTLVQKLVRLHGGRVQARSSGLGCGSEFEIELPAGEVPENAATSAVPPPDSVEENVSRKVLIVDDNADVAGMYQILLEAAGYKTRSVSDPFEAAGVFSEFEPDFALLDIGMPGMHGYDLCRQLKQLPTAKNTVFVSQSGWGSPDDFRKASEAGFREHLVKPLSSDDIRKVLQKYDKGNLL